MKRLAKPEPSDLRNNDLPYMLLCHRVLLMEKEKEIFVSEKSIQLSKFLLSYPMPLDFFNIFVIRSRTFPWIRLSKRVCLLVYKKNKINLYCDTILKYLDM